MDERRESGWESTPIAHAWMDDFGKWNIHQLRDHLFETARMARDFAAPFGGGDWAYLAGLWHDLGKYSQEFQAYIRRENGFEAHIETCPGRVDHSTAGAQHAVSNVGLLGHLIAYAIAGHHSGLLDGRSEGPSQEDRLKKRIFPFSSAPPDITEAGSLALPEPLKLAPGRKDSFSIAFFVRMIFSCLTDADFLDTERFMNPAQASVRSSAPEDIFVRMEKALNEHVQEMTGDASPVNPSRAQVRQACLAAAADRTGFYSLTVPTGGGKTLSSLAFALRHALIHGLKRIVYVVPFTTIIEQNAEEFRKVMRRVPGLPDGRVVIEHHSNFDPDQETPYSRLACENWDAPLLVTTSVQFYESLFGNRTSACRKLHNLARSVIILDEAQTLPVEYLHPTLRALNELATHYRSTIVLCTATQPAVNKRIDFAIGIDNVREIIPEPVELYKRLNRVKVEDLGDLNDKDLVSLLQRYEQALCIVNTRGHARSVMEALKEEEGHFHLSALMCPAHRSRTLDEMRQRLDRGLRCRVISTQLIEAGVDVDFPIVFRSLAGLDSIAQAAGRCNRHGRLPAKGMTFIFRSEHRDRERFLSDTANCATQIVDLKQGDLLGLDNIEHYFKLYYWDQSRRWDEKNILRSFNLAQERKFPFLFNFADVARSFHLISENTRPVAIPWDDTGAELCAKLQLMPCLNRDMARRLQRYTVQIAARAWMSQLNKTILPVHKGSIAVLISLQQNYSNVFGLHLEDPSGDAIFA